MNAGPAAGWYPDPAVPGGERWWDGSGWTDHRRTGAGGGRPHAPAGEFGPVTEPSPYADPRTKGPAAPGSGDGMPYGAYGQVGGDGGRGKVIALTVAGAVLIAAVSAAAFLLTGGEDEDEPSHGPSGIPSAPSPAASTSPPGAPTSAPDEDPGRVSDELNGFSLPVREGWEKPENVADHTVLLARSDVHECPGGGVAVCRAGWVTSRSVTGSGTSAKDLAEQDIEDAAERFYGKDVFDREPYGGVSGHTVVEARPVLVAGSSGFLVRWKVTTGEGPGGYVQSVAFRSPQGSRPLIVLRMSADASGPDAPPLGDLDALVRGARADR